MSAIRTGPTMILVSTFDHVNDQVDNYDEVDINDVNDESGNNSEDVGPDLVDTNLYHYEVENNEVDSNDDEVDNSDVNDESGNISDDVGPDQANTYDVNEDVDNNSDDVDSIDVNVGSGNNNDDFGLDQIYVDNTDYFNGHEVDNNRGVSEGGAGGTIAPPLFGRIEGATGSAAARITTCITTCPPTFRKPLMPLNNDDVQNDTNARYRRWDEAYTKYFL